MSAAQDFLNDKLSKNRFTAKQQQTLDDSGGAAVTNASEGIIPGGEAYAKYGKMPTALTDKAGDTTTEGSTPDAKASSSPLSTGADAYKNFDVNDKYKSGQWGSGKLSQQDLADKYGLDTSAAENSGDTAVWGTNRSGDRVFLGNIDNSFRSNDDVIKAHSAQADSGEINHGDKPEEVSSDGDVIGAMLNMWDGGGAPVEKTPEPEKERTPIEHSPEVKQAKERVRAYEDNIMSGKTSEDIFGSGYQNTGLDLGDNATAAVNSDKQGSKAINAGAAGIGTPTSGAQAEAPAKAAESFLTSQKSTVKKNYNFTPSYTYGSFQPKADKTKNSFVPNYSYGAN